MRLTSCWRIRPERSSARIRGWERRVRRTLRLRCGATRSVSVTLLDSTQLSFAQSEPGARRDVGARRKPFGTMTIRRRVTNNTGGNVTRLRYRIVEIIDVASRRARHG